MPLPVFPTYAFCFSETNADIERRVVSGGVSISGSEDVIAADGGGRVFAEFAEPFLDEPRLAQAWRANSDYLEDGANPVIVPLTDLRHQFGREIRVPTTLPWWSEDELPTATGVTLAEDAGLRATTLELTIDFIPAPLVAGMWLSIDHETVRHRAYRIREVLAQDATSATLVIRTPLREATEAGVAVETADPRCVMRLDGVMRSPTSMGYASAPGIRFVEDFRPSYA